MTELRPAPRWLRGAIFSLEQITDFTGRAVSLLVPILVLVTCTVVVMRHFLGLGSIALQESVTYMHSAIFLLGAAYALKHHHQVRVDIFYRRFSVRACAWIDALGSLVFLMPLAIFIGWISRDFVIGAWHIRETSSDSGGLALVYWLKSLIPLLALSLFLQALAVVLRSLLLLMGFDDAYTSSEEALR